MAAIKKDRKFQEVMAKVFERMHAACDIMLNGYHVEGDEEPRKDMKPWLTCKANIEAGVTRSSSLEVEQRRKLNNCLAVFDEYWQELVQHVGIDEKAYQSFFMFIFSILRDEECYDAIVTKELHEGEQAKYLKEHTPRTERMRLHIPQWLWECQLIPAIVRDTIGFPYSFAETELGHGGDFFYVGDLTFTVNRLDALKILDTFPDVQLWYEVVYDCVCLMHELWSAEVLIDSRVKERITLVKEGIEDAVSLFQDILQFPLAFVQHGRVLAIAAFELMHEWIFPQLSPEHFHSACHVYDLLQKFLYDGAKMGNDFYELLHDGDSRSLHFRLLGHYIPEEEFTPYLYIVEGEPDDEPRRKRARLGI